MSLFLQKNTPGIPGVQKIQGLCGLLGKIVKDTAPAFFSVNGQALGAANANGLGTLLQMLDVVWLGNEGARHGNKVNPGIQNFFGAL